MQKDISKNHQEEIKFWKEQTETLKIEVNQLRLGEEVYIKEKSELVKSLDEIEAQLKVAKLEAEENVKLKERLSQATADEQVMDKLRLEISELKDKLQASENQRSELEFVYQESVAKLEEKQQKLGGDASRQVGEMEFALEEQKVLVQELESKLTAKCDELERMEVQFKELLEKYAESEASKTNLQIELVRAKNAFKHTILRYINLNKLEFNL